MCNSRSAFLEALQGNSYTAVSAVNLPFIIGTDRNGCAVIKDFNALSHLLIAGATGTGKSTLAHAILLSLIKKSGPDDLRILLCDTKMVEFGGYRDIPHLLAPTIFEPNQIEKGISWALAEMNRRLRDLYDIGCRSFDSYNDALFEQSKPRLPHILLVIDDVASAVINNQAWDDLRQLAQNGRSAGIHLLLITQTPSEKRLSDIIKSSIPARAVFNIFSNSDEKLLLGAAKNTFLSDIGEIVFFTMPDMSREKICCYPVSDNDISAVVADTKERYIDNVCPYQISLGPPKKDTPLDSPNPEGDEMLPIAVDVVLETGQASVSILQRRLMLGYARAARIIDEMEEKGIVGPFQGSRPRAILITKEQWKNFESKNGSSSTEIQIEENADAHIDIHQDVRTAGDTLGAPVASINKGVVASKANHSLLLSTFQPKPAVKKSLPAVSNHVQKVEWIVFFCGCLLLLGCILADSLPLSDRAGMFLFALGVCIIAKIRSIRWISISAVFAISGFMTVPKIWRDGHFDPAAFAAVCFCLGISAAYIHKISKHNLGTFFKKHSATLRSIDAMTGLEFEEFTAQLLLKLGYTNVKVTRASGDQGIDVLAQKDGIRYAVQCKNYSHKLGNTPVQEAFAGKSFYGCDVAVVLTNSTFTDGAFALAESTGVLLWDRNTLADMIHHARM